MRDLLSTIRQFLSELRRRNVYKVAAAYVVVGWILIQAANVILPRLQLPGWTVTLVIVLVAFGFPIALVLAWALELTSEGVQATPSGKGAAEAPARGSGLGLWLGAALLAIGLGGGWWVLAENAGENPSSGSPSTITDRSIAVLPFAPLSSGEQSQTFARGIHDDLLTRLANISELKVISRTAVQQYRGTDLTTGQIADSLGVRWVMEGGVQVLGDQIQVNAQLIDPRSETHRWAEDYRRDLTAEDLFAIQGEITGEIAEALQAQLTAGEQRRIVGAPTQNLDAYRLYVKGRSQLDTRTATGMLESINFFRRAVQEDSSYALAWSGLADAAGLYPIYGPDSLPDQLPDQKRAARRALELAPDLAEAHASMGWAHWKQEDLAAALRRLRKAVELKPSYAEVHMWLGWLHLIRGRPEQGRQALELATDLSSEHAAAQEGLIWVRLRKGDVERARRHISRLPDQHPRVARHKADLAYHAGRWDRLRALARNRVDGDSNPLWHFYLTRVEVVEGDSAAARDHLNRIRKRPAGDMGYRAEALALAALGEEEATIRTWHRIGIADWTGPHAVHVRYLYPDVLNPIRGRPAYRDLIQNVNQQLGLSPDGSLPENVDVSISPADR